MLRVYLDQNKWINMAQAAHGRKSGDRFRDVLALARVAVAAGIASFPLDMSRYIETNKRRDYRSRREVAETMHELSRLHALAPNKVVLPCEIDAALQRHVGRPRRSRTFQVFGTGIEHVSGGSVSTRDLVKLPPDVHVPVGMLAEINADISQVLEWKLLVGLSPDEHVPDGYLEALASMTQDERYAEHETALATRLDEHGYRRGDRLTRAMWATDLVDIREPFAEALARAEVTFADLDDGWTPEQWAALMDDIPTRQVTTALRRDKHAQGQQRWEPNDLNDMISLPVAAVYCDVVVTERQWVSRIRRARVDRRYGTQVIADLEELVPLLVAAST